MKQSRFRWGKTSRANNEPPCHPAKRGKLRRLPHEDTAHLRIFDDSADGQYDFLQRVWRDRSQALDEALCVQAAQLQTTRRELLDWLRMEHEIEKPTLKLQSLFELDSDAFVAEVRKIRGKKKPLSSPALRSLRDEYTRSIEPARQLAAEALALEHQLSDLVNAAYGLTADEINLLWQTAPPRMPIQRATS